MKFNLLTVTSLLCGLFLLGSCAKDEPQLEKIDTEAVDNAPASMCLSSSMLR